MAFSRVRSKVCSKLRAIARTVQQVGTSGCAAMTNILDQLHLTARPDHNCYAYCREYFRPAKRTSLALRMLTSAALAHSPYRGTRPLSLRPRTARTAYKIQASGAHTTLIHDRHTDNVFPLHE